MQRCIEAEELIDVEIGVDQFFTGCIVYQAAISAHSPILVQDGKVLFNSDLIGSGIDFQELLIGNYSIQFAENKLVRCNGVCFGKTAGRESEYLCMAAGKVERHNSRHVVSEDMYKRRVDRGIEIGLQGINESL